MIKQIMPLIALMLCINAFASYDVLQEPQNGPVTFDRNNPQVTMSHLRTYYHRQNGTVSWLKANDNVTFPNCVSIRWWIFKNNGANPGTLQAEGVHAFSTTRSATIKWEGGQFGQGTLKDPGVYDIQIEFRELIDGQVYTADKLYEEQFTVYGLDGISFGEGSRNWAGTGADRVTVENKTVHMSIQTTPEIVNPDAEMQNWLNSVTEWNRTDFGVDNIFDNEWTPSSSDAESGILIVATFGTETDVKTVYVRQEVQPVTLTLNVTNTELNMAVEENPDNPGAVTGNSLINHVSTSTFNYGADVHYDYSADEWVLRADTMDCNLIKVTRSWPDGWEDWDDYKVSMTTPNSPNPVDGGNLHNDAGNNNWVFAVRELRKARYALSPSFFSVYWGHTAVSIAIVEQMTQWHMDAFNSTSIYKDTFDSLPPNKYYEYSWDAIQPEHSWVSHLDNELNNIKVLAGTKELKAVDALKSIREVDQDFQDSGDKTFNFHKNDYDLLVTNLQNGYHRPTEERFGDAADLLDASAHAIEQWANAKGWQNPNDPPNVVASTDMESYIIENGSYAYVLLLGEETTDDDGTIGCLFKWYDQNGMLRGWGQNLWINLTEGDYTFTLVVKDAEGEYAQDTVSFTVYSIEEE